MKRLKALIWKCLLQWKRNWIMSLAELICLALAAFLIHWDVIEKLWLERDTFTVDKDHFFYFVNSSAVYKLTAPIFADIAYTPHDETTDHIMAHFFNQTKHASKGRKFIPLPPVPIRDEPGVEDWLSVQRDRAPGESIGVVFLRYDKADNVFEYKIRTNNPKMMTRDFTLNVYHEMYEESDFLRVQFNVDKAILRTIGFHYYPDTVSFLMLPKPQQNLSEIIMKWYVLLALAYFIFFVTFVRGILHETCSGIKEIINAMGVSLKKFWFHWLVYSMFLHLPFSFVLALIFNALAPPFSFIHLFILWSIVILYLLNCTLILLVASNLIKSRYVGFTLLLSGWISLHVMAFPICSAMFEVNSFIQKAFMFLPLYNLMRAVFSISSFSGSWGLNEIFNSGPINRISVAFSLIVSTIQLGILTIVLMILNTKSLGTRIVPKYFRLSYFYQFLSSQQKDEESPFISDRSSHFESSPEGMDVLFDVRQLYKRYGLLRKKSAVENLSLIIYEGEILCLVGQRGAGKTTLLSLLSAFIRPSNGQIIFRGKDLFKENVKYYNHLGFCPQKNWYFSNFSVIEHLVFCGLVKGLSKRKAHLEGVVLLAKLKMCSMKNDIVSSLPEAMQRKLCLAMSIMGNPTILILDEPTSGMDPKMRREVWDILIEQRGLRTVVVSTDNMDEGEVLGDRIAIIDRGRLVCCGSTNFLKKSFKIGYHVEVVTRRVAPMKRIKRQIKKILKTGTIEKINRKHINIIVTDDAVAKLPNLFETLERRALDFGISVVYIKCTTMEDMFLRLTEEPSEEDNGDISALHYDATLASKKINTAALVYQRFKTLIWKRLLYLRRRIYTFLIMIAVTVLTAGIESQSIGENIGIIEIDLRTKEVRNPLAVGLYMYNEYQSIITYDINSENLSVIATSLIKQQKGIVIPDFQGTMEFMNFLSPYDVFNALLWLKFDNDNNITVRYRGVDHVACAATNLLSNILLRNFTDRHTGKIHIINHPLGFQKKCSMDSREVKAFIITYLFYLLFTCGAIIVIMISIPFIVEERISGFKLQQFLAGVSPPLYVAANFVFDFLLYMCATLIYLTLLTVFSVSMISKYYQDYLPLLLTVAFLYGVSGLSKIYLISSFIDNIVFGMLMVFILDMAHTIMAILLVHNSQIIYKYYILLVSVFSINPIFAAVMAVTKVFEVIIDDYMCDVCKDKRACATNFIAPTEKVDPLSTHSEREIFLYIALLIFDSILYLFILLSIEYGVTRKIYGLLFQESGNSEEAEGTRDPDVQNEALKVKDLVRSGDRDVPLKVDGLVKMHYLGQRSVNNVSFAVSKGECFGLLGAIGAGKSTVFQMLAGDLLPSYGVSIIHKYNVLRQRRKYQQCVGYCPQNNALLDAFTGAETLRMICLLKGISRQDTKHEVGRWFRITDMEDVANKRISDYKSDQKRMLSVAMALVGNPVVVLLDEPTTGVDPKTKRRIWNVIECFRNAGQAIVLSSYSIHECEALCTRLTILKDGVMRCIGTPEYLGRKFSRGFTVFIKLDVSSKSNRERLKDELFLRFPSGFIIDDYVNVIHYQIVDDGIDLSVLFSELLWICDKYDFIKDFTLSTTTFEHLFLTLLKTQIVQRRSYEARLSLGLKFESFLKIL